MPFVKKVVKALKKTLEEEEILPREKKDDDKQCPYNIHNLNNSTKCPLKPNNCPIPTISQIINNINNLIKNNYGSRKSVINNLNAYENKIGDQIMIKYGGFCSIFQGGMLADVMGGIQKICGDKCFCNSEDNPPLSNKCKNQQLLSQKICLEKVNNFIEEKLFCYVFAELYEIFEQNYSNGKKKLDNALNDFFTKINDIIKINFDGVKKDLYLGYADIIESGFLSTISDCYNDDKDGKNKDQCIEKINDYFKKEYEKFESSSSSSSSSSSLSYSTLMNSLKNCFLIKLYGLPVIEPSKTTTTKKREEDPSKDNKLDKFLQIALNTGGNVASLYYLIKILNEDDETLKNNRLNVIGTSIGFAGWALILADLIV